MKRTGTIWILYAVIVLTVFFCSSCASSKPKYVASKKEVKAPMQPLKQRTIVGMHLWGLIMTGWIYHFTNKESN